VLYSKPAESGDTLAPSDTAQLGTVQGPQKMPAVLHARLDHGALLTNAGQFLKLGNNHFAIFIVAPCIL